MSTYGKILVLSRYGQRLATQQAPVATSVTSKLLQLAHLLARSPVIRRAQCQQDGVTMGDRVEARAEQTSSSPSFASTPQISSSHSIKGLPSQVYLSSRSHKVSYKLSPSSRSLRPPQFSREGLPLGHHTMKEQWAFPGITPHPQTTNVGWIS